MLYLMRIPDGIHSWNVTPDEAVSIQKELAGRVRLERPAGPEGPSGSPPFRFIAGVDSSFPGDGTVCLACVVLWDLELRVVVEVSCGFSPALMPYIPGLLSFREVPAVLEALKGLVREPDVLLCDGQGVAHPRRLGIAAHLGVLLGMPSAGCAKSRLTGYHREPEPERGSVRTLRDRGEVIGAVVRTKDGVKPLYVSAGNLMSHADAVALVLACDGGYRLPEPTRLADKIAGERRREVSGDIPPR